MEKDLIEVLMQQETPASCRATGAAVLDTASRPMVCAAPAMANRRRYLIVKGDAGLGNRICSLGCAIDYAQKTNRVITVDWSDGLYGVKGDNVFHRCFQLKGVETLAGIADIPMLDELTSYPARWGDSPYLSVRDAYAPMRLHEPIRSWCRRLLPQWLLWHERLKMIDSHFRTRAFHLRIRGAPLHYLLGVLRSTSVPHGSMLSTGHEEAVVYYADYWPKPNPRILREHVQLRSEIRAVIDQFARRERLTEGAVGVHVRSTDKRPSATIGSLIELVRRTKAEAGASRVFLATDNAAVVELFADEFPGQVIEYPKIRPNAGDAPLHKWAQINSQQSLGTRILEESIIDMWLLSRCRWLIWQGNSSFSHVSAMLHPDQRRVKQWS